MGDNQLNLKYDLVANICNEVIPDTDMVVYKVHVYSHGLNQWYQIQDLTVEEIAPQMIFLSETYIQVIINIYIKDLAIEKGLIIKF